MPRESRRFDLSDWLIHFVRGVHLESESCPPVPEDCDYGTGAVVEDVHLTPMFVLRLLVRQGQISPSWSMRGGAPDHLRPVSRCLLHRDAACSVSTCERRTRASRSRN